MSTIEEYDDAKLACDEVEVELKGLISMLGAVMRALEKDPVAMLLPAAPTADLSFERDKDRVYPVDETDLRDCVSLDDMPDSGTLRDAIIRVREARAVKARAFGDLTDIAKGYVVGAVPGSRRRR